MAKNSVRDYSATNSLNTDIQSIDISEGCSPAGINNAVREVMADLKDVSTGAVALETPSADQLNVDNLRLDGNTISSTNTNGDITIDPAGTGDTVVASGNVGIGESSPDDTLTINVNESSNDVRAIHLVGGADVTGKYVSIGRTHSTTNDNINSEIRFGAETGGAGSAFMSFAVNGNPTATERMRIDSSGNVLVGTATVNPADANDASGAQISQAGTIQASASGSTPAIFNRGSDGAAVAFLRSGSLVGSISITTTSTAYNTSSDYRLKENVAYDWDATTRLKQLKPARFNFIADADTTVDGFLAHEAQTVVPEAVTGTKDAMRDEEYEVTPAVLDDDGNEVTPAEMGTRSVPVYQGIDQSKLVPLLVKTIQELEARITALETK